MNKKNSHKTKKHYVPAWFDDETFKAITYLEEQMEEQRGPIIRQAVKLLADVWRLEQLELELENTNGTHTETTNGGKDE